MSTSPISIQDAPGIPARSQQRTMTKAERRELQEKQRAAKAASAAQPAGSSARASSSRSPQASSSRGTPATPSRPAQPSNASRATPRPARTGVLNAAVSDTAAKGAEDLASRGLRIFSHFGLPKQTTQSVNKGDIHPSIVRLALQFSSFKITGANARCIATLEAFKTVIQDYLTPPGTTLSRHLMTHLSPQISHLVAARPMSVTMGNAIRQLKLEISGSDIDLPEQDAKDALCYQIDNYVRDRIIIADQVIQDIAGSKIKDGDVILVYARSSVVEKVLIRAYADGKDFSVMVVDSRPMLEGKNLLRTLTSVGIPCTYLLLPAIASIITEVSMVLIGAHALHSNGAVFSRAGTALVAMMAKQHSVPVVVCCETYKFCEGVALDSFTKNELAPTDDLFNSFPSSQTSLILQPRLNLEVLNPLYDLTPPTSITAVVTEVGVIPPSSISSIPLALGRQTL